MGKGNLCPPILDVIKGIPTMKVPMAMDAAPNPNPLDIWISMDIHVFTHYVHHHNNIEPFWEHFSNIPAILIWTMEGRGGEEIRGGGVADTARSL
jgi:hypothetical protein